MIPKRVLLTVLFIALLAACASTSDSPTRPEFPDLIEHWVVDNGCGFSNESLEFAYEYFEALNQDRIAQVAVVCQEGVSGGFSEASTWISEWLNHEGLGSMEDKRALAILIRPDVVPADFRVVFNPNDALYWLSSYDEFDPKHNAANYANADDFDGCLEYLAVSVDEMLRDKWSIYGPSSNP